MTAARGNVRPVFIVLEGIDGSGTTTQLDLLVRHLTARDRSAISTREPTTGPVGKLLRTILLGQHSLPGGVSFDGRAMALLFASDRRDHLAREIEPALAAGTDVVSDRYVLSSLAYQAVEADRRWVEGLAEGIRTPDLTVLLDVPLAVAADRRARAGRPIERYDADSILARVAENYRSLCRGRPDAVVLDGSGSVSQVAADVAREVDRVIEEKLPRP